MGTLLVNKTLTPTTADDIGSLYNDSGSYSQLANTADPKVGANSIAADVWRGYFQFDMNDLGGDTYDNEYIAANLISVDSLTLNFTVNDISGTGTYSFVSTDGLINPMEDIINVETMYDKIGDGDTTYVSKQLASGADSISLGEDAITDFTSVIGTIENDHNPVLSDVGKISIGCTSPTLGVFYVTFDRDAGVSLDIQYNLTVPNTSPTLSQISRNNISVIQSSESTLSLNRKDYTIIRPKNVASVLSGNHRITQFEIYEDYMPVSGAPLMSVRSNQNIRTNGNVVKLNKNELKIILKHNTWFKVRMRFKNDSQWSNWSPIQRFKTRDKDYKRV